MHTYPLAEYMVHIRAGAWDRVADLMLASAKKLAAVGADFAVCPDNTIHRAFDRVARESPIPWLHIARAVADEAQRRRFSRLGITGTQYLMTGPVYPDMLGRMGIACEVPDADDRERIDTIIFGELVKGIFREDSRRYFSQVFGRLKDRGCDAVVLACTEIPLIVDPADCPLPVLDSTRLLARAAIREAL